MRAHVPVREMKGRLGQSYYEKFKSHALFIVTAIDWIKFMPETQVSHSQVVLPSQIQLVVCKINHLSSSISLNSNTLQAFHRKTCQIIE